MTRPTRGFVGRAHEVRDPRLPPGQYDVGKDWPVLTAEVTMSGDSSRTPVLFRRLSDTNGELGRLTTKLDN